MATNKSTATKTFAMPTTPEEAEEFVANFQMFSEEDLCALHTFYAEAGVSPAVWDKLIRAYREADASLRQLFQTAVKMKNIAEDIHDTATDVDLAILKSEEHRQMILKTNIGRLLETVMPARKKARRGYYPRAVN